MNHERLLGALARGYCSDRNSSKVLDPDLIEAMAAEVKKEFDDPPVEQTERVNLTENERLRKALTKFLTMFPNTIDASSNMGEALFEAHEALAVKGEALPAPLSEDKP